LRDPCAGSGLSGLRAGSLARKKYGTNGISMRGNEMSASKQFPWVSELLQDNFLRVYDVVLDLRESLQMSDVADIPLYQARVKWKALLPVDGIGWRDAYCRGRWDALKFLQQQGLADEIEVIEGNQRWENRLRISAPGDRIEALCIVMKEEFEERSRKPGESEDEPRHLDASPVDVLISWSKTQSKLVASALHGWLPGVLPGIKPWMSSRDIEKGREWFQELQDMLLRTRVCIICVTPENVRSPWIYYEAGAIAARGPDVLICPYLVGVSPSMLADGPLGQWQCTAADQDDTWELIKSLNSNALASRHDVSVLRGNFDARWPGFEAQVRRVAESDVDAQEGFVATDADQLAGTNLSAEARTMIVEVSREPSGTLLYVRTFGGTSFQTHGVNLCPDQSPRTVARWKAAMDGLVACNILEPRGYKGEIFVLTAKGYDIADALRGESSGRP